MGEGLKKASPIYDVYSHD